MPMNWGYEDHNGPEIWPKLFQAAGGSKQSPINITTDSTIKDESLKENPLQWSYEPHNCKSIMNTGAGWRVDINGEGSLLTGGPLQNKYEIAQFHSHWGQDTSCGSEHTVDGKSYPAEIHLVHWNTELFPDVSTAASSPLGLAVLGIFVEIGEENPQLNKIISVMNDISFKNKVCTLPEGFDIDDIIPGEHSYWTYEGSLTTPPCSESVTWIVLKTPIQASEEQIETFRRLRCSEENEDESDNITPKHIVCNFRPPQPLGDRIVKECL